MGKRAAACADGPGLVDELGELDELDDDSTGDTAITPGTSRRVPRSAGRELDERFETGQLAGVAQGRRLGENRRRCHHLPPIPVVSARGL